LDNFKYAFEVNEKDKAIQYADMSFTDLRFFRNAKEVVDRAGYRGKYPDSFKAFNEKYGITPSSFKKVHNTLIRKLWVSPIERHALRYAFTHGGKLKKNVINQIWEMKDEISQCEKDGLDNIIPLVLFLKKSPQELKKMFGKGVWKKLTKNSMTRNLYIAKIVATEPSSDINLLLSVKSKHLKLGTGTIFAYTWSNINKWLIRNNLYNSKGNPSWGARNMYLDTRNMAAQLGVPFNEKWSLEKMQEKHDEYQEKINARKYDKEPFSYLIKFKTKEYVYKEFTATLLHSPYEIHQEGTAMKHCVGSYAGSVGSGDYLVYSITKDGERSSTLGISVIDGEYKFHQHYKHCNKHVKDEDEIMLADSLVESLNSQ